MKKITLIFYFLSAFAIGQTNSTGMVTLSNTSGLEYMAQIDVTSSEVTLTLVGPDDRWLGLGFDAQSMTSGKDVVIFDGTNLTDRTFVGVGSTPTLDANQDWTIQSNSASGGVRTVVGTRALSTSDPSDYDFNLTDTSLDVVWARGNGTFSLGYHGGSNKGPTTIGFTLGVEDFARLDFNMFPNPVIDKFSLELEQKNISQFKIEVFDILGKKIFSKKVDGFNEVKDIYTTSWSKGVYLVKVMSDNLIQTKKIIKN